MTADAVARRRRRAGIAAVVALGLAWAGMVQSLGWAQMSYFTLVKAMSAGTAQIDAYHWETGDLAYSGGHYYSVKAPGMPIVVLPAYEVLKAVGAPALAKRVAANVSASGTDYRDQPASAFGGDPARAAAVTKGLEEQVPLVWVLGLLASVLPALALVWLVRRVGERLEPGLGTAAGVTLGLGTLVMPFATQFFGSLLAALLAFAGFLLAWRERDLDPAPRRPWLLGAAGLCGGLAVFTEYPLGLIAVLVAVYVALRAPDWPGRLRRAAVYVAGFVVGILPLLAYNWWAFGSPLRLSYRNAVGTTGVSGHDRLGLNAGGFFGIDVPSPRAALELLVAPRGVLIVMPVLVAGAVGIWLLWKRGRRAEALLVTGVALALYIYNAGYWLPFGGGSPGPRFLIPLLPFLALGLPLAWRRFPSTTLALAVPSAVTMLAATLSYPLVATGQTHLWPDRLLHEDQLRHTVFRAVGLGNGWPELLPVVLLVGAAVWFAARATPALDFRADARWGALALAVWGLLALVVAPALGEELIDTHTTASTGRVAHGGHPELVAAGLVLGALALAVAWWRSGPRAEPVRTTAAPGAATPASAAR
jgi:hypothetical protein